MDFSFEIGRKTAILCRDLILRSLSLDFTSNEKYTMLPLFLG
ncbi:hypothetical protein LEP1GSC163_3148 [Leptospira santarosai str. CBC379]|uniref:Uncharacterized protein n=2 Tax=Leptospira santarosai TaxID=28183 RepID=M6V8J8_9LEPT|nr:hypothetical protein LEP1GSC163_3148 [Leptospira santarosai str. CBC379]EKT84990.2 hypothetical protein LSS_19880 [Leptospira santarosai serovar Shermani str. LT 821]EMM75463.1 hypothetical protein LEP1GSC040_3417 [Leptospira santarosai str. 2000030832]EMO45838.1 hypothetical protein LEP1GSC187_3658 [Leptospira santarosai str. ZUN179]